MEMDLSLNTPTTFGKVNLKRDCQRVSLDTFSQLGCSLDIWKISDIPKREPLCSSMTSRCKTVLSTRKEQDSDKTHQVMKNNPNSWNLLKLDELRIVLFVDDPDLKIKSS